MTTTQLLASIRSKMQEGINSRHSDYHIMNVSYILNDEVKTSCTVLRRMTENAIWFNTDYRSQKVAAIKENNKACIHFYSKKDKIQISIQCRLTIHHDNEVSKAGWDQSSLLAKQCYRQIGAPCEPFDIEKMQQKLPLDEAYHNFSTVEATMEKSDVLFLKFAGHERYIIDMKTQDVQKILP